MKEEIFPITSEHLQRIFLDRKFVKNLKKVRNYTLTRCCEAGFYVDQKVSVGRYSIRDVNYSGPFSMEGLNLFGDLDYLLKRSNLQMYHLISLHSHTEGDIIPSTYEREDGDLWALNYRRQKAKNRYKLNTKPIEVIMAEKRDYFDLLLIQEKSLKIMGGKTFLYCVGDLFNDFYYGESEEVAKELRRTGLYNAEIVTFDGKQYLGDYLEKIASFTFMPQFIDEKVN